MVGQKDRLAKRNNAKRPAIVDEIGDKAVRRFEAKPAVPRVGIQKFVDPKLGAEP